MQAAGQASMQAPHGSHRRMSTNATWLGRADFSVGREGKAWPTSADSCWAMISLGRIKLLPDDEEVVRELRARTLLVRLIILGIESSLGHSAQHRSQTAKRRSRRFRR